MDISKYENTAPVWVGNWGKYNEGELVGDWITLPVTNEDLHKFLKEKVLIGTKDAFGVEYEEYGVFDTDEYDNTLFRKLDLDVGEHTGVFGLNDLAKICSTLSDHQLEALGGYLEIDSTKNIYEIANYALQVDDLTFCQFDSDLPEHWSDEEKFAYTIANEDGLYAFLDKHGIVNYFNFEAYGRDAAQDVTFTENGWIWNDNASLDSDRYDLKEISKLASERFDSKYTEPEKELDRLGNQSETRAEIADASANRKRVSLSREER